VSKERQRALATLQQVQGLEESNHKRYASLAFGLPSMLRSAGLCQTLAFLASRKHVEGQILFRHLTQGLTVSEPSGNCAAVLHAVSGGSTTQYLAWTREALALADWYVRHVQGQLRLTRTQSEDDS